MISTVLNGGHASLRYGILTFRTLCNRQIRSASLNSAIGKGLRRSKGVGFRGKERDKVKFGERNSGGLRDREQGNWRSSQNERYSPGKRELPRSSDTKQFRGKRVDSDEDSISPRPTRASRFNDPESSFGQRSGRRKLVLTEQAQRAAESDRMAIQRNPDGTKLSASRKAYLERADQGRGRPNIDDDEYTPSRTRSHSDRQGSSYSKNNRRDSDEKDVGGWRSRVVEDYKKREKAFSEDERSIRTKTKFSNEGGGSGHYSQKSDSEFSRTGDKFSSQDRKRTNDERSTFTKASDKRMPLSIPYTTPASEFLYGTSVVETALTSKKDTKRKLYKLYIQRGENGDNEARDLVIERLARKAGVEVHFVNSSWIRLMDKMSGGRPHNGYILEASPLPKLPILSLGTIASDGDKHGFSVALDYQSREEAAINGTSNFVNIPQDLSRRKPFVLLLDSIQDPGNLGGIIRTASFLGVTAVAISTRNSASFTPVVLKASAGASEQVTLFSINKPAEFLENSKSAGWKIYAAVAPTPFRKPNDPPSTTTDELGDPLLEHACILMLGNEGEGLRWNLRSKADCDLSIPGSKQRGGVDSLNVSVAAGILCGSFLRNRNNDLLNPEKRLESFLRPKRDLF